MTLGRTKFSVPEHLGLEEYFVNRYVVAFLLFPEYLKFWKSKIHNKFDEKIEKCEIFPQISFEQSILEEIWWLRSKYKGKTIQIYANHHPHRNLGKYFIFLWISKFLMFWKEEKLLFKFRYIYIYIYIYEIFLQTQMFWHWKFCSTQRDACLRIMVIGFQNRSSLSYTVLLKDASIMPGSCWSPYQFIKTFSTPILWVRGLVFLWNNV